MQNVFHARRNPSTLLGIGIGFLILVVCTAGPIMFGSIEELTDQWAFFIPAIFILFFTYVLTVSLFKMFITYSVKEHGILIYRPPFHRKYYLFEDILNIRILSTYDVITITENSMIEQEKIKNAFDIAGFFRMIRSESPLWRYFTIAPTARVTTVGAMEHMTSLKINSEGGALQITMKDGSFFYLSPKTPDQMLELIQQKYSGFNVP